MPDLLTIDTSGYLLTETSGEYALLTADFGEGYEAGALIGHPEGLRTWTIKIDVLPDDSDQVPVIEDSLDPDFILLEDDSGYLLLEDDSGGLVLERLSTRAQYLWRFFRVSKTLGNQPFWIEVDDPEDGNSKLFLVCFADTRLTYSILCAKAYSTGLQLRQRRLVGVESPILAE